MSPSMMLSAIAYHLVCLPPVSNVPIDSGNCDTGSGDVKYKTSYIDFIHSDIKGRSHNQNQ